MKRTAARVLILIALAAISNPSTASAFLITPAFQSSPGTYTLDTDALTLVGPNGFLATGQAAGNTATFVFTDFQLTTGANLVTQGTRAAAIHSLGTMFVGGGGIRALAAGGAGGEPAIKGQGQGGGFPGYDFFGGAGGGGGYGGAGGRGQFENATFDFPGAGGPAYGDLDIALLGGSGGGGGKGGTGFQSAGGAGGGAIELVAGGILQIDGVGLNADGVQGQPRGANHTAGGGGSGGAIRLRAAQISILGLVAASGGRGGDGVFQNGGGGGGGRILIETLPGGLTNLGQISVAGGTSPSDFFGTGSPGQPGVLTVRTVPEPAGATLLLLAIAARCRRRSRDMQSVAGRD
jgi:hypothetical protein